MEEAADGQREETTEQPTVNTEVVAWQKKTLYLLAVLPAF